MPDKEVLFSEPKPEIRFPLDTEAEIRGKGEDAKPWPEVTLSECHNCGDTRYNPTGYECLGCGSV